MARFKPVSSKKTKPKRAYRGLIPCALLILAAFGLMFLLMYEMLKSGR